MAPNRASLYLARSLSLLGTCSLLGSSCAPNSLWVNSAEFSESSLLQGAPRKGASTSSSPAAASHTWKVDPAGGLAGGLDLWSVSLDESGNVGFAVGSGGVVLRWNGSAWNRDAGAMTLAKGGDFHAVAIDGAGKQALAVGAGGLLMRWNGIRWQHEVAAEKLAIGRYLGAVSFDAKGRSAWVVGQYGMALHWNGSKWSRTSTPFTVPKSAEGGAPVDSFGMWSVWVEPDGARALASGNGNRILRWDGRAWKDDKKAPNIHFDGDAFSGINSIAASKDGQKGWMVGGETTLTWSGSKWQKGGSPNDDFISVDCDALGVTVFAVDMRGRIGRWNGMKWQTDTSVGRAADGKGLYGVSLSASGNVGFAVGQQGLILRWNGKAWTRDSAGEVAGTGQFSSVATTADGTSGMAVCFDGTPLLWDGNTWSADTSRRNPGMRLNVLWLSPTGDQAFGAGEEGIYRWNGLEWTAEPSGRSLHSLAMTANGKLGFAGSIDGSIYRYNGTTWALDKQGSREAGPRGLYAMTLTSDGKLGLAAGSDIFLRWDGSAWHKDAKLSKGSYSYVCLDAKGDLGFATGDGMQGAVVLRWDGKSWSPDKEASRIMTDGGPYCFSLSADGRRGIAVSFQGPVFAWDGVKWSRDTEGTKLAQGQNLVSASLDTAGKSGWVLGWHGFLMRYRATETTTK